MNLKNVNLKDTKAMGFIENFCNDHGPTAAMVGGVFLMGCALFFAFKASEEVTEIKNKYREAVDPLDYELEQSKKADANDSRKESIPYFKKEKKDLKTERNIKLVLAYKWVLLFGAGSAALMFLCNYLNGAKIAGLGIALAASEDKLKKLKANAEQLLPSEKVEEIKEKTIEQMFMENLTDGDGPFNYTCDDRNGQLFMDGLNCIMFPMEKEDLIAVLEDMKKESARNHGLNTAKYYERLGIIPKEGTLVRWWGPKNPFNPQIKSMHICGIVIETIDFDSFDEPVLDRKEAGVI